MLKKNTKSEVMFWKGFNVEIKSPHRKLSVRLSMRYRWSKIELRLIFKPCSSQDPYFLILRPCHQESESLVFRFSDKKILVFGLQLLFYYLPQEHRGIYLLQQRAGPAIRSDPARCRDVLQLSPG